MNEIIIYGAFFIVAFLYASVGHGGASGYLAVMALLGFSSGVMKPTALLLNVMVSLIAFVSFYRANEIDLYFRGRYSDVYCVYVLFDGCLKILDQFHDIAGDRNIARDAYCECDRYH